MSDSYTKNPRGYAPAHALAHTPTHAPSRVLNVLIACEESQAECLAFRELGHNAYSCDIQPCRFNPDYHIQGDVTPYLHGQTEFITQSGHHVSVPGWDLIIAHPPCTYLCKMGSLRMRVNGEIQQERYTQMLRARDFFQKCLDAKAPFVAVENPIPMKLAQLPRPSCYIHPSWFGVKYTKKTLYWLKNLPPIFPTIEHPNPRCYVISSRGKYRSRTFPQVAAQLARQWSEYILSQSITL